MPGLAVWEHGVVDTRDRYEAQVLERRRMALALRRGSSHSSLLREPHPTRALLGGVGIALLAVVAAAITGLVGSRAPKGWDRVGNLVLDQDSGQRYIVTAGPVLHPVLSDLSVLLAYSGGAPAPVKVKHKVLTGTRRGDPLGRPDAPYAPPRLLPVDAEQERCVAGPLTAVLLGGAAPSAPPVPVLVRSGPGTFLLAGGSAYRIHDDLSLGRLGYAPAAVVPVPPLLLATAHAGPPLAAPAVGVGPPNPNPLQREGALVTDAGTGASYVVAQGRLRLLANRTAVQLVYGPQPPPAVSVPDAAVKTAPQGEPVVAGSVPDVPPPVAPPGPRAVLCVDGTGHSRVLNALPTGDLSPVPRPEARRALLLPKDGGLLAATTPLALTQPDTSRPVYLLAQGKAFPLESPDLVRSLGYSTADVRLVTPDLLALVPKAPVLQAIPLDR